MKKSKCDSKTSTVKKDVVVEKKIEKVIKKEGKVEKTNVIVEKEDKNMEKINFKSQSDINLYLEVILS